MTTAQQRLTLEEFLKLPEEEPELILVRLALADIDGDRGGAEDSAVLVPKSLDEEIERALAPEQLEIGLKLLGRAGIHRLSLSRGDGL